MFDRYLSGLTAGYKLMTSDFLKVVVLLVKSRKSRKLGKAVLYLLRSTLIGAHLKGYDTLAFLSDVIATDVSHVTNRTERHALLGGEFVCSHLKTASSLALKGDTNNEVFFPTNFIVV